MSTKWRKTIRPCRYNPTLANVAALVVQGFSTGNKCPSSAKTGSICVASKRGGWHTLTHFLPLTHKQGKWQKMCQSVPHTIKSSGWHTLTHFLPLTHKQGVWHGMCQLTQTVAVGWDCATISHRCARSLWLSMYLNKCVVKNVQDWKTRLSALRGVYEGLAAVYNAGGERGGGVGRA